MTSDPSASMRMSSSNLVMPSVSDYTSTMGGLERSVGVYGSRSSLMGGGVTMPEPPAPAPPSASSRYLQSSASSSNILSSMGMGSVMDSSRSQNFPLQRINTSDKISSGQSRAQKTLSMHGMPSLPTTQPPGVQAHRSSMGGASGAGGNSKWWCAPFGADAATGCDYLGAARPLEQVISRGRK